MLHSVPTDRPVILSFSYSYHVSNRIDCVAKLIQYGRIYLLGTKGRIQIIYPTTANRHSIDYVVALTAFDVEILWVIRVQAFDLVQSPLAKLKLCKRAKA